ncbi:MAG: Mn2+/Fe2+ NRAMP family transporter [Saprospiraceae bacterium]|jgi:Mn2+/Fe2+ NRAMP family transporter
MQKANTKTKYSIIVLSILTGILICYYVITRAFPMLIPTEEVYGSYYFPRVYWVFPHIVLGIVATIIGPFNLYHTSEINI